MSVMTDAPTITEDSKMAQSSVAPGITRDDMIAYVWDAFKEVNGVRPRFMKFDDMSMGELIREADSLQTEIDAQIVADTAHEELVLLALHHPCGVTESLWGDDIVTVKELLATRHFTGIEAYFCIAPDVKPVTLASAFAQAFAA